MNVILGRLRQLVEVESPSNDAVGLGRCAELLDSWFAPVFARSALRPVDGAAHLLWSAPRPAVLVLGHFDTVWPLGTLADWPFTIMDDVARGPGVFDMKAGIVQLLDALERLRGSRGASVLDRVSVLLTADEEIGSTTSRAVIETEAARARAVLVCEPSADGGALKIARKGVASYRIEAFGRAAHAGLEPERGVNATIEIAHQIMALQPFTGGSGVEHGVAVGHGVEHGLEQGTTVTATVVSGGTTSNSVPECASVLVDARAWTRTELDRVDLRMRALTPRLPGAAVTVTGGVSRYPLEAERALALLEVARAAARDVGQPPPDGVRSGGGSDGNLTAATGVPTLDGLGAIGGHPHARSEWVDAGAMPGRAALLAALIERLCRVSRSPDLVAPAPSQ